LRQCGCVVRSTIVASGPAVRLADLKFDIGKWTMTLTLKCEVREQELGLFGVIEQGRGKDGSYEQMEVWRLKRASVCAILYLWSEGYELALRLTKF